jgi:hypothetical protein
MRMFLQPVVGEAAYKQLARLLSQAMHLCMLWDAALKYIRLNLIC